jgi:hypothetical protein
VTPNDKTTAMPRLLAVASEGSKTKYSLGFMRRGEPVPDSHCEAGSSSTHTNRWMAIDVLVRREFDVAKIELE